MVGFGRVTRTRVGTSLAIAGAVVGLTGTLGLAIQGQYVPGTGGFCEGEYCVSGPLVFQPFLPLWVAVLAGMAGTLPLVVLVRPRFWAEGVLAVTASYGFVGALVLLNAGLTPPGLSLTPPMDLFLLWVLGSALTAVGFAGVRPGGPAPRTGPVGTNTAA